MITRNENLNRRSIELTSDIEQRGDATVQLRMGIHHDNGGNYIVSVWRQIKRDMFVTVSIMEDSAYRERETKGARYSAKNLKEIADSRMRQFESDVKELTEWAKEITTK